MSCCTFSNGPQRKVHSALHGICVKEVLFRHMDEMMVLEKKKKRKKFLDLLKEKKTQQNGGKTEVTGSWKSLQRVEVVYLCFKELSE